MGFFLLEVRVLVEEWGRLFHVYRPDGEAAMMKVTTMTMMVVAVVEGGG